MFRRNESQKVRCNRAGSRANEESKNPDNRSVPPKCINEDCSERNWLKECQITSKEKKDQLYREYKEGRTSGESSERAVWNIKRSEVTEHFALFTAPFAHGAVHIIVLMDQGADSKFIPPSVLTRCEKLMGSFNTLSWMIPKLCVGSKNKPW